MDHPTTIAVDLAKSVFEVSVSREPGRVCQRKRLTRAQFVRFLTLQSPATVLMEACGTAHYWARLAQDVGHRAVLLPIQHVCRYRLRDKTDHADTRALLEAYRNEKISPVPVKTPAQQAIAGLHRIRSGWLATRTARLSPRFVLPRLAQALADPTTEIPQLLHPALQSTAAEIRQLEANIRGVERQLDDLSQRLPAAATLRSVPGIGLLTATALIASVGDPSRFKNGRRLASSLGLVPKEHSSGSSRHLGSITKRGDPYLRTLLIHGARSVLLSASRVKHPDRLQAWALAVQHRRGHNRATVALANKLARIAWAVSVHQTNYQSTAA